jgi:phosphatidylglycerophosphate synthase
VPGPAVVPSREEYFRRWSSLHGGYEPASSRMVGPWLGLVYRCARPLARTGVRPGVVTLAAVSLAALAALSAWGGARSSGTAGGWTLVAVALVALSGLGDSLDGAVAMLTGRVSAFGAVLDSVADRCSDLLYLLALYVAGGLAWVCVAGAVLMLLHEYVRARATTLGMRDIGVVTVWERPTRVIVTAMFLLGAGCWAMDSRRLGHAWASAGAWAWLALGLVGIVQLLVVVRRRLRPGR